MSLPPGLLSWALPQIESLLPLDPESLTQIIRAAATAEGGASGAGKYLKELLGESSDAVVFIAEFTARIAKSSAGGGGGGGGEEGRSGLNTPNSTSRPRTPVAAQWSISGSAPVSKRMMQGGFGRGGKKGDMGYKKELRRPEEVGENSSLRAYRKGEDEESYYTGAEGGRRGDGEGAKGGATTAPGRKKDDGGGAKGGATTAISPPGGKQAPANTTTTTTTITGGQQKQPKLQGTLISDRLAPKASKSTAKSTTATPSSSNTKNSSSTSNKIHISATSSNLRAPQHNTLSDLEAALYALEQTINSTPTNPQKRTVCNCQATRHDLLLAAPNCLSCGKIICIKEGPGPCTFCGTPLLSGSETQDMISFLKEERGREKMAMDKRAHKKPEVSRTPKAHSGGALPPPPQLGLGYGTPAGDGGDDEDAEALKRAREHRDRLLSYQASNAQRTKIVDEAADFDTSAIASAGYAGLNMWATPEERALQLKKQQRRMREVQWAVKEAWEKRRVVVSIDISGGGSKGKVVTRKEMREVEMDEVSASEEDVVVDIRAVGKGEGEGLGGDGEGGSGSRSYARNPLLKGLVKPVFTPALKKPKPTNTRGKGKSKAPEVNDDCAYIQQEDDDSEYDGDNYEKYELPEVVKERMRHVRMGATTGEGGGGGWKRVLQDEQDVKDNEKWLLDRGSGREGEGGVEGGVGGYGEEPGCG
ncbi:hypothetical protein EV426DRAFT_714433 [Tirmania nivea]|nr:hypothetical protein EV426DRAFT_714433 [Tirmania nivea]